MEARKILELIKKMALPLGFNEIEEKGKGQGATVVLYDADGNSIQYDVNIDSPSIYIDADKVINFKFYEQSLDVFDAYSCKVTRNYTTYEFDLTK